MDHRDDSTFSFDPSNLNVKKLNKDNAKKNIDHRKGVLLASYSKKKTRRKKGKMSTETVASNGNHNGSSDGNGMVCNSSKKLIFELIKYLLILKVISKFN